MKIWLQLLLFLIVVFGQSIGHAQVVQEASGISRQGEDLLIVSDKDAGGYFRFSLDKSKDSGPLIHIDNSRVKRVEFPHTELGLDLESIGVLADGRVVALSERLHALVSEGGIVAEYDTPLAEFGNRGLEGLAILKVRDGSSMVAVLWEGGYPEFGNIPQQLQKHVGRFPMRPVVWFHGIQAKQSGLYISSWTAQEVQLTQVELDVPRPEGKEPDAQRFRAPDLVWHTWKNDGKDQWGFIVLLSSQNSPDGQKPTYKHKWLQRFTLDGKSFGNPLDLDTVFNPNLQEAERLKTANWEGLGWFEEGKSLMIIHDSPPKGPPSAYILRLPNDW